MELFKNEDCETDFGYIQVVLDQPFYEPGNEVTGNVYLRITSEITGVSGIEFEMKGTRKNSFIRYWME